MVIALLVCLVIWGIFAMIRSMGTMLEFFSEWTKRSKDLRLVVLNMAKKIFLSVIIVYILYKFCVKIELKWIPGTWEEFLSAGNKIGYMLMCFIFLGLSLHILYDMDVLGFVGVLFLYLTGYFLVWIDVISITVYENFFLYLSAAFLLWDISYIVKELILRLWDKIVKGKMYYTVVYDEVMYPGRFDGLKKDAQMGEIVPGADVPPGGKKVEESPDPGWRRLTFYTLDQQSAQELLHFAQEQEASNKASIAKAKSFFAAVAKETYK